VSNPPVETYSLSAALRHRGLEPVTFGLLTDKNATRLPIPERFGTFWAVRSGARGVIQEFASRRESDDKIHLSVIVYLD
jgi:hypothetical protein